MLFGPGVRAAPAQAMDGGPEAGGLLRAGLTFERNGLAGSDGFELFDVRAKVTGRAGLLFDYEAGAEYDTDSDRVRLLDVRLGVEVRDELLRLDIGQFKAPFGRERLLSTAEIPYVERAQATEALTPDRQVGIQLGGRALEGRLSYAAGMFNGNGRTLENDNDAFMFAGRVEYNTIGEVAFYDDLVVQVGANAGFSRDSLVQALPAVIEEAGEGEPVAPVATPALIGFTGDRVLLGADVVATWRRASFAAEYLRGEFDLPGVPQDLVSEGWYAEAGYELLGGAVRTRLRYDTFTAAVSPAGADRRSEFLVPGVSVRPDFSTRVALQYAIGLGDTTLGPGWADGQFVLLFQLALGSTAAGG